MAKITTYDGQEIPGYDPDAVDQAAQALAEMLTEPGRDCVQMSLAPGNGWHYWLILTRLSREGREHYGGDYVLSVPDQGTSCAVTLVPGSDLVPEYLQAKVLPHLPIGAAVPVAHLLNGAGELIAAARDAARALLGAPGEG